MNLSLTDFTIELCDHYLNEEGEVIERPIRLSSLINGISSTTGVYNEKLTEKENNQYSLTFNIEMYVDNSRNPLIDFMVNDRKIRLKQKNSNNIEFYITGKTPAFNNKGVSYAITCQDAFSYQLSRQSIKMTMDTNDEEIWGEYNTGPKAIDVLTSKVLEMAYLTEWHVNPDINNHIYQFPNNLYFGVEPMKVSLEISESTPYNIILEIAKLFNAAIIIDYDKKEINFLNKEKMQYKGLKLKPEVNLSNFSYSEKGDNLYNIMYVSGGEDAYGNYLSVAPAMPLVISKIISETVSIQGDESALIYPPLLTDDNYYISPTFCRVQSDPQLLYVKRRIENIPQYIKTDIIGHWEDSVNIEELKSFIISCYSFLNEEEKTSRDMEEITMFFRKLQRVPHAGPYLYNFDYWKKNKLLSIPRYNALIDLINIKMRNVNLKLMAYMTTYNIFNYKLNSMIQQEEELIALMAAESTANANNNTSNVSASYMRYLSECVWIEDTSVAMIDNAYFPIGILNPNDASKRSALYGRNLNSNYSGYSLPDFNSIIQAGLKYYCITNNTVEEQIPSGFYEGSEEIVFLSSLTSSTVYVKYSDLKNLIQVSSTSTVNYNINGLTDSKIVEYQCQLAALWNQDYQFYYRSIYGNRWLDDKIRKIEEKRQRYLKQKQNITKELQDKFGENWENIDSSMFPSASNLYIDYSDLTQQLEDLCVYVGGQGKRKYKDKVTSYDYKGIYNYYISALEAFRDTTLEYESIPLCDIVEQLRDQQTEYEKELYHKYGDIIRETHYNDSTQITDEGLYAAAYKQFLTYQQPTKSYSSTYITNYDIENIEENVDIGDIVELHHQHINEVLDIKSFIITIPKIPAIINTIILHYQNAELGEDKIEYKDYYENTTYEVLENNKILIKTNKYLYFDIENSIIKEIYINGQIFNAYDYNIVESFEKVYKSEPVQLRVTGITKDLRSKIAQLTVEENTLYNTLVDRLIYFLQG